MSNITAFFNLKRLKDYADWRLLLFLLLFLDVKLVIKIAAIILIYFLQPHFKFGFKFKNSRLPLFYPLVMVIAFIDLIINKSYASVNYLPTFLAGMGFWLLCILAIHQVKLAVERNELTVIHSTILVFFVINTIISLLNMAVIVWGTHAINPYIYQGEHQKYFISTGDYIKGLTFDTSTTNAVLNAFGVVYFFFRKNALMMLICMATLLLTGSNFTNLAILVILLALFILKSTRDQKSLIAICLFFLLVFMIKISPQNNHYVAQTFENIAQKNQINKPNPVWYDAPVVKEKIITPLNEEKKIQVAQHYLDSINLRQKQSHASEYHAPKPFFIANAGRIYIPKPNLNLSPYQPVATTPPEQRQLVTFISTHKTSLQLASQKNAELKLPGKVIGHLQTINFLKQHPAKILTGDGIGNFSSKLAFRASGIGVSGGYPSKYIYIDHDFETNHLDLYLTFFSKKADYHSLTNSPYSTYDQLLSEYGLLGLSAFMIYYLGFFAKNYNSLTYGIPIIVFMMMIFFIDYWFEQLSVLIVFELLLFMDIKEHKILTANER